MNVFRHRPFVWLWSLRCGWLLWRHWNAPKGHGGRYTFVQCVNYAASLSEMMDDAGFISPSEAIDEDRHYWTE